MKISKEEKQAHNLFLKEQKKLDKLAKKIRATKKFGRPCIIQ